MKQKVYVHYETAGSPAVTASFQVDEDSLLQDLLRTFLDQLLAKQAVTSSIPLEQCQVKTEEGKVLMIKSKKSLLTQLDDNLEDLFLSIAAAPAPHNTVPAAVTSTKPPTIATPSTSSGTSSSASSPMKPLKVDSKPSVASPTTKAAVSPATTSSPTPKPENMTPTKMLDDYMKKRWYKRAKDLALKIIETCSAIDGNTPPQVSMHLIKAVNSIMQIHLHAHRYEDVLRYGQRALMLSKHSSIETYAIMGRANMCLHLFHAANEAFDTALTLWNNKATRQNVMQPVYVQEDNYFLHLTALHAECTYAIGDHNEAANILNRVFDNLLSESHVGILTTYASFTLAYQKMQETVVALLKAISIVGTQRRYSPNLPLPHNAEFSSNTSYFPDDMKRVKKLVSDFFQQKDHFEYFLKRFPPNSRGNAEVYAYLASTVKDRSAIPACIKLYQLALQVQPNHANFTVNLIHAYEVLHEYDAAMEQIISFCAKNLALSVGRESSSPYHVSCAQIVDAIKQAADETSEGDGGSSAEDVVATSGNCGSNGYHIGWIEHGDRNYAYISVNNTNTASSNASSNTDSSSSSSNSSSSTALTVDNLPAISKTDFSIKFTDRELDLLALFATTVKILFLQGQLASLPLLIKYIEAIRRLSKTHLHETLVRNEVAYYCDIVQILYQRQQYGFYGIVNGMNPFANPLTSTQDVFRAARQRPMYVCGDSHCLSSAWSVVNVRQQPRILIPKLVTGIKQYHLREDGHFYPKASFHNAMKTIPNQADVMMLIGEIDCREGILFAVEQDIYDNIEDGMLATVRHFIQVLRTLRATKDFTIYIHPIPPVLNETRQLVMKFNQIYQRTIHAMGDDKVKWLDFVSDLCEPDPKGSVTLKQKYKHDGTHLHPCYVELMERALNNVCK